MCIKMERKTLNKISISMQSIEQRERERELHAILNIQSIIPNGKKIAYQLAMYNESVEQWNRI